MNSNAKNIILLFNSRENVEHLRDALLARFEASPTVKTFLSQQLCTMMSAMSHRMFRQLADSEPLPGITPQITCMQMNITFLNDTAQFIQTHVLGDEVPVKYRVSDGNPTSRYGRNYANAPSDSKLATWATDSGRGVQMREDSHGDTGHSTYLGNGTRDGIEFCDQSHMNTSNHLAQFQTQYIQALNVDAQPHTSTPFGIVTDASDARLLSRRIFNNNERGVENGIKRYEARLYARNVDRDNSEGLQGSERDCKVYGYDMQSIYDRTAYKNAARVPKPPMRPQLQKTKTLNNEFDYN